MRTPTLAFCLTALVAAVCVPSMLTADGITNSRTYRPEIVGRVGVVAAGRHFAAEAGMRMLARGGNAIDAGVAATFAAGVTEISHFGLGGEVPLLLYLADRNEVVVVSGQGTAPAIASHGKFKGPRGIPSNGPSAGTVPAVVDALCVALAEFGTLSLGDALGPAIEFADGFPWYDYLTVYLRPELEHMAMFPSGARVYLQGPGGTIPETGSVFRQPDLARTLRALVEAERDNRARGRKGAIYAARDRFYKGEIGQRIAQAVQEAGGLLTARDLAGYRGRVEVPTRGTFKTRYGTFEIFKTGFWGQGPVLLQTLALLQGFDLERMGQNSTEYIHIVTEALKLALADRDEFYGDPEFAKIPAVGLLSDAYTTERRKLLDATKANNQARPGDPWKFEPSSRSQRRRSIARRNTEALAGSFPASLDTTTVNVADAKGNLFSASPSSAWFAGGVFIAGDTGVPLGNRMQAFVLDEGSPNVVAGGKRPRTTLSPTIVLRDGRPFLGMSSPGGDSQDQQILQVFLNIAVFGMSAQEAIEAPRFNSLNYRESFRAHRFVPSGLLRLEDRIAPGVINALTRLGHVPQVVGPFMLDTGVTLAGFDAPHGTVFGAADVRRQRFVTGW